MSQSVNVSTCPFHGYVHKEWPLCPHHCATDHRSLPSHHRVPLAAQLPTYISSSKRSRQPHDLLLVEDPVDTKADQAQSNYTPGRYATFAELCLSDILFSLWVLRKRSTLRVYVQLQSTDTLRIKLLLLHPGSTMKTHKENSIYGTLCWLSVLMVDLLVWVYFT